MSNQRKKKSKGESSPISKDDIARIIDAMIEVFPLFSEIGKPDDPISIEEYTKAVHTKLTSYSPELRFIEGVIKSSLRMLSVFGLLDEQAFAQNRVNTISYNAYLSVRCCLDIMKHQWPGLDHTPSFPDKAEALKTLLFLLEERRVTHYDKCKLDREPIRSLSIVVPIVKGWSPILNKPVFLLRKRKISKEHFQWVSIGGSIQVPTVSGNASLSTIEASRITPSSEVLSSSVCLHLKSNAGLDSNYISNCRPIEIDNRSHHGPSTYHSVWTEWTYYPYYVSLKKIPAQSLINENQLRWFTFDVVEKGKVLSEMTGTTDILNEALIRGIKSDINLIKNCSDDIEVFEDIECSKSDQETLKRTQQKILGYVNGKYGPIRPIDLNTSKTRINKYLMHLNEITNTHFVLGKPVKLYKRLFGLAKALATVVPGNICSYDHMINTIWDGKTLADIPSTETTRSIQSIHQLMIRIRKLGTENNKLANYIPEPQESGKGYKMFVPQTLKVVYIPKNQKLKHSS